MRAVIEPQVRASDPVASVFVEANAGAGKTSTLVKRVARLLLAGARPQAILCVTYTKAAAAEMQSRLFETLGKWAVMSDAALVDELAVLHEVGRDLSAARALFARALETPGGLKIQTLHGFCEQLLRRFPLEAGLSPGFTVLEDAAAARTSSRARDAVAAVALAVPDGAIGEAYAHFSVQLDWESFNQMLAGFESRRATIAAYLTACGTPHAMRRDIWARCGISTVTSAEEIGQAAVTTIRWGAWRRAAAALAMTGKVSDTKTAVAMGKVGPDCRFADLVPIFLTAKGTPRASVGTKGVDATSLQWLTEEQGRVVETRQRVQAATIASDTGHALTLAAAYAHAYSQAKAQTGSLDFADLIGHARTLLTHKADAAWVLYKLDGGLEHVLLDEAQDTAPEQWEILKALTGEFFTGAGAVSAPRSVFAVGDEKQSIFSFQGASPERLAAESLAFGTRAREAGSRFDLVKLLHSWRSRPEILAFVDGVFLAPDLLSGLRPGEPGKVIGFPISHLPRRCPGGCVDLWPMEEGEGRDETDPWAPVDAEPPCSANKALAQRIAMALRIMTERGEAVVDRDTDQPRSMGYGDVLILVRRRNALFDEIIRALKREGVPVGGADRLKLSDHGVFEDLVALGRFACFAEDDLNLAALLRSPFCDIDETGLFDLAHGRAKEPLWTVLGRRRAERIEWVAAHRLLTWTREAGRSLSPFDFFSRFLARLDDQNRSQRQRILTRLGAEAADALDAFVAQALAQERGGVMDLETFLAQMAATELEIKREAEAASSGGKGEVRVMTVHGAKGLEAPIVILPDTTARVSTGRSGPLLDVPDGGFLWAPRKDEDCQASTEARDARQAQAEAESARLLYVALTRARDRLIVCGIKSQPKSFERSWYDWIARGFEGLETRPIALPGGGVALRFGADPNIGETVTPSISSEFIVPHWVKQLATLDPVAPAQGRPSQLRDSDAGAAPSPLQVSGGLGRYRRGEVIHRLLQLLPDLAPAARPAAAAALMLRERDLTDSQRQEMAAAALSVLNHAQFAGVFGPGSKPEVALAGIVAGMPVSGRVDRLVVSADRVLVIDYKTNRPAPVTVDRADIGYIRQMAAYSAILALIYPERKIEAALVWTDGPRLMAVPEKLMAQSLADLAFSG